MLRDVYIVDGSRTPFIQATDKPNPLSIADLAIATVKPLLARQGFSPADVDEVIVGCVIPGMHEANIARTIALRANCGEHVKGWMVQRNCATGLQAIDSAAKDIMIGRSELVLAGGVEVMSRAPVSFSEEVISWLAELRTAKGITEKLKFPAKFHPKFLLPVKSIHTGMIDPVTNLSMPQKIEELAHEFNISRQDMDHYAIASHFKAANAAKNKHYAEITPLFDWHGGVLEADDGILPEINTDNDLTSNVNHNLAAFAELTPIMDGSFGQVTAGNSSQVADGAAFLLLASHDAVLKYGLTPTAKITDIVWTGLEPNMMGLGAVHAIAAMFNKKSNKPRCKFADVDYWEINEAFAAQVIACSKAMADQNYCQEKLGLTAAMGAIAQEKLNVDGGAIATGNPIGATGVGLVLHLMNILRREEARHGVTAMSIGGGQGGALLLENIIGGDNA